MKKIIRLIIEIGICCCISLYWCKEVFPEGIWEDGDIIGGVLFFIFMETIFLVFIDAIVVAIAKYGVNIIGVIVGFFAQFILNFVVAIVPLIIVLAIIEGRYGQQYDEIEEYIATIYPAVSMHILCFLKKTD